MLTIRKEQLRVFDQDRRSRFLALMLAHLRKFFPARCESLGERGLREWIEHGTKRAATYHVVSERDVCKYIDIMLVFGKDFDQDARFPWAARLLKIPRTKPGEKMNLLFEAAKEHQAQLTAEAPRG